MSYWLQATTKTYERLALECEAITQGLMILELYCYRSLLASTKNLVYVDYLTIAPWNRRSIENPPMYKGVGSSLLKFAIEHSFDLDYKGRIGLHSLPGAENFYAKFGMVDLGYDSNKQGLRYFEISSD
ncbi:MAG: GNAT family N-acetyltransferase [Nostoc sp.]